MEHFFDLLHLFLSDYPLMAPIVFVGVHTLMAIFFLPCSPMTLMAGALWGGVYGLLVSMIAAAASSAATFLLSRSFLHRRIENILMCRYPRVAELMAQAAVHDWKIVAIAQLNPLIPASSMGYAFGLSRVTFIRYLSFSILFMLPLQVLFVMTGHSVIGLFASDGEWRVALALICLVAILSLLSKRIYKKLCQVIGVKNGA